MQTLTEDFLKARRRLSRRDPGLRRIIQAVGACTLRPNPDGFDILARSIVSQMISTKAALGIAGRLERELAPGGLTPAGVLAASEETMRGAGLSRSKVLALRDLAERVQNGQLPLHDLARRTDEEVVALLTPVRGIGVWTAEMFLIFSLGRLDVLPVGDLGLRAGVQQTYGLLEMPKAAALRERAEAWRPYRTVATWYFWRSRGFVPHSE
ncbi:MAG TPA: DNA-3-methyladenine glycosylase [Gemmataceae bacterium]|nr:DNA-3-methyladenine glycosylase [Gemmataceae bacterium]